MDFLNRLNEGKLGAFAGLAAQALLHDAFFWLFWVLVVANGADWIAGRVAARAQGVYSRKKSREGLQGKAIALAVLLIVRTIEAVLTYVGGPIGIPSTHGWAASAIAAALIYEDVESMDRHRMALGRAPIPLLGAVLAKLRDVTGGERREGPARPEPVENGGGA